MKLIIDIDEVTANEIKDNAMFAKEIASGIKWDITSAIVNGIPLEQEPCDDAISRQAVHIELEKWINNGEYNYSNATKYLYDRIDRLPPVNPQEPKTGHCRDCKWWKDSDGLYRRGSHAESQCPINRKEVFEGNGYCYMFEPQERSE